MKKVIALILSIVLVLFLLNIPAMAEFDQQDREKLFDAMPQLFAHEEVPPEEGQALTVKAFVERYNAATGRGFALEANDYFIVKNNTWFLNTDQDCLVAVTYDPMSAIMSQDYEIKSVFVARTPSSSVGAYVNAICAAVAAVYPDVPEETRLYSIMMTLRAGESIWGMRQRWTQPVAFNTEAMGQFVYQENSDRFIFLFNVSEE